jgi:alpha-glucosidase
MMNKRQDHFNQSLGECIHFEQNGQILLFETENTKVQLSIYRDDIIRIRAIDKQQVWENFSYAVVVQPTKTPFELIEKETGWEITTAKLRLHIGRSPIRFTLYDLDGTLINADDQSFGISRIGHEWYNYKALQADERFIGLGEKTGHLDRRGKWYEHWNTDAFAYGEEEDPLYMSTPFYMGITQNKVYGIFLDNSYRSIFNFGASNNRFSYFQVPDGELDYYLIKAGDVAETVMAYTWLTGTPSLPPKWSLGYQQCRYSYYPDKEVLNVARTFREKQIPCDVIYLDIHYMDQYKLFTWNNKEFPDPAAFVSALKEMNFRVVVIIDPGVKVEAGYHAYESAKAADLFVKYPDGSYYSGDVWPGTCHFPDFTAEKTRLWWGEQFKPLVDIGITGFWNDMNEPVTWGKKLPDLIEFEFDGHGATHRKAHNVYGMQMARATAEGVQQLLPNERAFILSRAGFSGSQRFAASWTGDNSASDDHMLLGVRLMLSMGLAGLSFTGVDIGGFVGEANPKLFTRWMQIGAFSPLFRGHTMINSRDSEPWSYGEEAEEISRNFIRLRYRLMPYLYTAFHESAKSGLPVARSLAFAYPHDVEIYNRAWGHQFLFGPSILVAAVNSWMPIQKVYLPEGDWYDFYNSRYFAGGQVHMVETGQEILPVFVKAAAVIPMHLPGQHIDEITSDTLDLHVFGGNCNSLQYWYEDDGSSHRNIYGQYCEREISHLGNERKLLLGEQQGHFQVAYKKIRVYFHGITSAKAVVQKLDSKSGNENVQFIAPISNFDPFFTNTAHPWQHLNVPYIEFVYQAEAIEISY